MPTVTNLTQAQVDKIQIDEGVVYINYDETTEEKLGPTRGGGEFSATQTIRDIEFDGRVGKTAGMQVIEGQEAVLKINCLCCSNGVIKKVLPGCVVTEATQSAPEKISNARAGVLPNGTSDSVYLKNVTMFAKLMDGSYKKITLKNALHEAGFTIKAVQKAENELAMEFYAHYDIANLNGELYSIEEVASLT